MTNRTKVIGELLTTLERREAALMEWGFFDVAHTSDEIIDLFSNNTEWGSAFQDLADGSEELFVDNLAECRILYRIEDGYPRRYRSRFAESVRLLARLRQRFRADDWEHAPELVSQVRMHLASRRIPVRDHSFEQVWADVTSQCWSPVLQRKILAALMSAEKPLQLAAFQVRAITRILAHYRGMNDQTGTVVTAGTGGGKTKSFYIPALMGIAADIAQFKPPVTRVLALYPRNVLLADQFAEATAQASIINRLCLLERPVSVGALIGDVPFNANFETDSRNQWALNAWPRARSLAGRLVPHLRHPDSGERLVWTDEDRRAGRTVLRRDSASSEIVVEEGVVRLTRDDLIRRPPDIFLTSIEMLNKELSGEIGRAVLGFGASASNLRLVLLDEIHTYEGITGAQVPWILRRLSHWIRPYRRDRQLHFVGLSATLRDASEHLAVLTGVVATRIEEIAPRDTSSELSIEGQEYNVVLKSHPGSGAGVLSTSIQTAMLGGRLLTPAGSHVPPAAVADASEFFGRKVFGFTDNLDVVNRWLPDLKNAEQTLRLARLREPHGHDAAMDEAGQIWKLPVLLGHNLNARLQVDRISSQDPGIDARADIVIATSSLEVGYDDPDVGMVLQHKAPRSAASFLQRKGRAGRRKGMRPWTIVVLSDHGRDRWAFRDSEQLFAPILERLALPVFNPYLLRIQATWFLVDWIASKVGDGAPNLYLTRANYRRGEAERLVSDLIDAPAVRQEFTKALKTWLDRRSGGFRIVDAGVLADSLLWIPPRAVLRHVVPDLHKFMEGGYRGVARRPRLLPRFLPSTTWEVLDAQDVELQLDLEHSELLDAGRALYETVPGRVSRRFVVDPRKPSKWPRFSIQLLLPTPPSVAAIDQLCESWTRNDELKTITLFQPTAMVFEDVPDQVKNSSNAQWDWELMVARVGEGGPLGLHVGGLFSRLFENSTTWLHRDQIPMRVYRFARRCNYEILLSNDQVRRGILDVGRPSTETDVAAVAIGYARSVDGLEFQVRKTLLDSLPALPAAVQQEMRSAYLRYCASRSQVLRDQASSFAIGNLCVSAIGMVIATALQRRVGLEEAWGTILDKAKAAAKVMRSVLAIDGDGEDSENRRLAEMIDLWQSPDILAEMKRLIRVLWAPLDAEFDLWLKLKIIETIRAAVEEAVRMVLPEAVEGALKIESLIEDDHASILIIESDPGGVGFVERLLLAITSEPEQFSRAVEWSLTTCAAEETRSGVLATVRTARHRHSEMRGVFDDIRIAADYCALEDARLALVSAMTRHDLPTSKRNVTALLSKALGPGSKRETERWLVGLSEARERFARRVEAHLDSRSFAYWLMNQARSSETMRRTLRSIIMSEPTDTQLYQAFLRLTLEPCVDSCPECLGTEGENSGLAPSRRLASLWLGAAPSHHIDVDDSGSWRELLQTAIRQHNRIKVRHRADQRRHVATTLAAMMTAEVDRGYHSSPIRISGVRRCAGCWETDLEVDPWEGD
jgi:hypothetical protein